MKTTKMLGRFCNSLRNANSSGLKFAMFLVLSGLLCLLSPACLATTYYWYGSDEDSPLDPANYHVAASITSDALLELPVAGSVIHLMPGNEIRFDDESAAFLSSLANVQVRDGAVCTIDVLTNVTVATKFDYNGYGTGDVVKRGAGTLFLSGTGKTDYYASFSVQGGDLVFPQSGQTNGTWKHLTLSVAAGSTIYLDGGASTTAFTLSCKGISGNGDIAYTNDSAVCTFSVGGSKELFSGVLSGSKLKLDVTGSLMLGNAANSLGYGGTEPLSLNTGTLGFRKLGNDSDTTSSIGKPVRILLPSKSGDKTLLCLAEAKDGAQSSNRNIRDYGLGAITFDGGAYGGFMYEGNFATFHSRMKELVLTGSNVTECVWNGQISTVNTYTGYDYLTKRGTGTWRLAAVAQTQSQVNRMAKLAGIGVENGTLAFGNVRESGTMCSLGAAPADYLFGYALRDSIANAANSNKVTYAIRLGNAADMSEEGTLEYVGTENGFCTTRPIAVIGRGRVKNSAANAAGTTFYTLRWENFRSVVPPEDASLVPALSTLTFDGSKGVGWATNITEDTGAAPLRIAKTGSGTWNLGGTLGFTGGIDVHEGTLAVGAAPSASQPYLRVERGAVLNLTGGVATVTGFDIDAESGVGTISGVAFAPDGTLSVSNVESFPVNVPCDSLSGCTSIGNLSGWTLVVNGEETAKYSIKATAAAIQVVERQGLTIIVR